MKLKGFLKLLVILAGDIEVNPGPCVTCTTCIKKITRNQIKAKCKTCGVYYHAKCMNENFGEDIYCRVCAIFTQRKINIQITIVTTNSDHY